MPRFVVFLSLIFLLLISCGDDGTALKEGTPAYEFASKLSEKVPYLNPEENNPLVKTKYFVLKTGENLKHIYENMGEGVSQFYSLDSASLKNVIENNARQFAEKKLLLRAARERGIQISPADMDSILNLQYSRYGGEERFGSMLSQRGIDFDFIKQQIRESVMIQKYLDKVVEEETDVSDEELQKIYDSGKTATVRHILLRTQGKSESEKDEIRDKMEEILEKARGGEDFAELAQKYSEDPGSKEKGGLYEDFERGMMVKPFEDAAFSVPEGEISDIIETQYGYHILKVIERKKQDQPFEEIRDSLRLRIINSRKNQVQQEQIEKLKEEADLKMVDF
ncbi:MAG: hypothetical protein EH225_11750 [Calditrichaeota bacterium]|nr:peptidylprolyl isomerase [Calditrichota bacterium]RQV92507.1 MAG: hypothetical protein EH221_11405 [bacterium]RQV99363.1 MAG: hypothetical protein EH225_11750 [Calditrichota bacterium]